MDKKYYAMIKGENGELEEVEIIKGNILNNISFGMKGIMTNNKTECVIKDNRYSWGKDPLKDIEEMKRIYLEGER